MNAVILKWYNVNEEAYRVVRWSDESYRELATRVRELTHKWLAEYKTIGEVVEAVATEQLLEVLSEDVRVYVREHKPKTCMGAVELAEDYQQAQRKKGKVETGSRKDKRSANAQPMRCFFCGQMGHKSF